MLHIYIYDISRLRVNMRVHFRNLEAYSVHSASSPPLLEIFPHPKISSNTILTISTQPPYVVTFPGVYQLTLCINFLLFACYAMSFKSLTFRFHLILLDEDNKRRSFAIFEIFRAVTINFTLHRLIWYTGAKIINYI